MALDPRARLLSWFNLCVSFSSFERREDLDVLWKAIQMDVLVLENKPAAVVRGRAYLLKTGAVVKVCFVS